MSVKVELQTDEAHWKSQAETYLDITISSLAKRKQQLEEDLTYVQEELGAIARCHCWVPLLGAIAGVPLLGAIARCHC